MAEIDKRVKTICATCSVGCGIEVEVKDNRPVRVSSNKEAAIAGICPKGAAAPEWYDIGLKRRLVRSMQKVDGGWKEISSEEAIIVIADRLKELARKYGPQTLSTHVGGMPPVPDWHYFRQRFALAYGTENNTSPRSYCFAANSMADCLTFGDGIWVSPTIGNTRCMVIWGANPTGSVPPVGVTMRKIQEQGIKSIVVDPRRTRLAANATLHIQPRPSSDGALALGLMNVIILEKLYDEAFVRRWTVGFDQLAERVKDYPPEKVADITWVPVDKIIEFARTYANTKPATIFRGDTFCNMDNGFQAARAICALIAITGNVDVPGGSFLCREEAFGGMADEEFPKEERPKVRAVGGGDEYPLFWNYEREASFGSVLNAIITGKPYPIKAMIIQASNPVLSAGDSNKVKRALQSLDFLVVHDIYFTETCQFADIVLPAATFLEKQEILAQWARSLLLPVVPIIEPPQDCWPEWKFWFELAKKMGYERYFPWKDIREAQNHILKVGGLGVTVEELERHPGGFYFVPREWRKFEKAGKFGTPSGKIELYSEALKRAGDDPLPTYREPAESPLSRLDLAKNYPLVLITGERLLPYPHTFFRDLPKMKALCPEPLAEINTETAKSLEIENGDTIIIESPRGAVQMKARVTDDIHPRVVSLPHGWGGMANENYLTSHDIRDPFHGFSTFRGLLCRLVNPKVVQH